MHYQKLPKFITLIEPGCWSRKFVHQPLTPHYRNSAFQTSEFDMFGFPFKYTITESIWSTTLLKCTKLDYETTILKAFLR